MQRLWRLSGVLLGALFAVAGAVAAEPAIERKLLSPGTEWETPWYSIDSGVAGPTVMVTGGIHGNEPAGRYAAEQIRDWPIFAGKLIVVPAVNKPGLAANIRWLPPHKTDEALRDPNRNFPVGDKTEPETTPCRALWELAKQVKPDWVIDLHEGFDFQIANKESVGSSVIYAKETPAEPIAEQMLAAVNATIEDPQRKFVPLRRGAVKGSFVHAAVERLGCSGYIAETTFKDQPLSLRVRQHRLMASLCLQRLGLIRADCTDLPVGRPRPDAKLVGVYDGGGVGGNGAETLVKIFAADERFAVVPLGPADLQQASLEHLQLLVFPGGSGSTQARALGGETRQKVREFVHNGGGYLGICAGAYLAAANYDWSLALLDTKTLSATVDIPEVGKKSLWYRGASQLVKMELTPEGKKILGDHAGLLNVRYHNGPIVSPAGRKDLPTYLPLAYFRSEVSLYEPQKGTMVDTPAIVASAFGKGRVLTISPHPEATDGLQSLVNHAAAWLCRIETPAAAPVGK